jgi:hypothetical protein
MAARGRPSKQRDPSARAVMLHLRAQPGLVLRLAQALQIHHNSVYKWDVVPLDRVVEVERITNIPREVLRPDFHLPVLGLSWRAAGGEV